MTFHSMATEAASTPIPTLLLCLIVRLGTCCEIVSRRIMFLNDTAVRDVGDPPPASCLPK